MCKKFMYLGILALLLGLAGSAGAAITLNPTADASSQSGDCDTASMAFSLWNHIFMKFDLSSVATPVTSATLWLYYESSEALTIYVADASSDSWTECGTMPSQGSQLTSASASGAGWYEFDVTTKVDTEASGDNVVTFCITNSSGNWWALASRESSNAPQLVVESSGGGGLPSPWQNSDVGSPSQAGTASESSGTFTIEGGGSDIWGTYDSFHYVYQSLSGDGEISARVASVENTDSWAKAGVMIRETLTGGSTHAMMAITAGNGAAFQRRTSTDGSSDHTAGASVTAPYWVRLVRSGNTLTGYQSSDGSGWSEVGSATVSMATDVYIGLAVTAHNDGTLCTSDISNVAVTGGGGPPLPGQASNPNPANSATGVSTSADLSWSAGSDAASHDVYFGQITSPPFVQNQAGTTYDPGTLNEVTTYYWRIDEKNASGTTTGNVWSFTTEAAPQPPGQASNPSPANGATSVNINADLSWSAGSGATSHDVYFGQDSTPDSGEFQGNQGGTTYDPGTLANSTTYYWRIDSVNAVGTTTGNVWSFATAASTGGPVGYTWCASEGQTVVFSETVDVAYGADGQFNYMYGVTGSITFDNATFGDPIVGVVKAGYYKVVGGGGNGTGLTGDYYDNMDFTGFALTRVDATVNFNWGSGSPDPAIGADTFSVQWSGQVEPLYSETYTFYTTSDDGVRLWVNGQLIIDNWTDHGPTENSGNISLSAGVKYDIAMDFYENGGGAVAELRWSSASQAYEIIPQTQLYEAAPQLPGQASNPNPSNGATSVSVNADLSWTAGSGATSHDVYFGQDSTPDSGEFQGNQGGTTFDPGTLAENTTYYWRIDSVNAVGTTTGNVWSFTTTSGAPPTGMTVGCNFWRIDWGEGGWSHYFADGVNWSTTTNPWNPTFVAELQESKMKCLRFMDWVITNGSLVTSWSQRIPKTANHYYGDNTVPLDGGTGYGVAYEWQIDLCNRVGADIWVTVPHAANADYQTQLANLLYNNLNSNLKIYVEYSNECWNWGFYQTTYCDEQSTAVGIRDLDVGEYCEPWWKYKIYASVRLFERFENVFGVNSPRLVKVIGCQVGYNWGGYDYNHQIIGELACLNNSTINPNGITVDAWAAAPYWGTSVGNIADMMLWAHNSLVGTGIKLICYEGGSDNYSDPAGCVTVQLDPGQEQLYIDALNILEQYCEGVFNQYCFVGDCWGLKKSTGDPASEAPKWRGAMQWINSHY